ELRHVANHEVEDLVEKVVGDLVERGVLENELRVDDEREDLTPGQQKRDVLHLIRARRGAGEELAEDLGLLGEALDVGQLDTGESKAIVVELDLPEALGAALPEEKVVI